MANKKILLYLKEGIKRGHSIFSLQKALVKQGFKASDVNTAVKEFKKPSPPSAPSQNQKKIPTKTILIIIILVAIVGTTFYFKDNMIKLTSTGVIEEKLTEMEKCMQSEMPTFDMCLASAKNDLNICEGMEKKDYGTLKRPIKSIIADCIESLYSIRMIKEKNIQVCNNIKDKYQKEFCLAFVNKDITRCSNALNKNNPDRIEEEALCRAFVNDDVKECDLVKGEKRVSTIAPDQPESPYEDCLDSFYTKKAIESKDKTYCEKIISLEAKGECLAAVTGKTSYCGLVKEYRCNCILSQATE